MSSAHLAQQAKQLRSERVELIEKARIVLDKAEGESRDLNTEERSEYDKITDAAEALKPRYERLEEQSKREVEMADAEYRSRDLAQDDDPTDTDVAKAATGHQRAKSTRSSKLYTRAMNRYLAHGEGALSADERAILNDAEVRIQTIGTGSEGGFATSTDLEHSIAIALEEEVAMRQLATVLTISSDRTIPVINDPSDLGDPALDAENAAYEEDDIVFQERTLGSYKLTRLVRASEELVADDDAGFIDMLPQLIARRFAPAEETWFVAGTGSSQPRGVALDSIIGLTTASATAIVADELIDLFYAVRRPYRARASWLMNDSTVAAVRKLKGSDANYLWAPGVANGEPDRFLGKPLFTSDAMEAIAATKKTVLFGDFSYYWIGDRGARTVKRLVERYAELGQIGFISSQRTDGVLTVKESVKHLIQKA